MKNIYRRVFGLLFVLASFNLLIMPIHAADYSEVLRKRAYPEAYIAELNQAQKDALGALVEENDLVYLGMEEFPDEYGETDVVLLYSGVLRQENATTFVDRIFMTVDYQWRFVPEDLYRDKVAVLLNGSDFQFGTYFTSTDYMLDADTLMWVSGKTIKKPNHMNEHELVYPVDLKFNGVKQKKVSQLKGTAHFELIPTEILEYDTSVEFATDIVVNYNHIIPEQSVLQTDGPLAAGKLLLLVVGALSIPILYGAIWHWLRKQVL